MTHGKPSPVQREAAAAIRAARMGLKVTLTAAGAWGGDGHGPRLWVATLGARWYAHRWDGERSASAFGATAADAVVAVRKRSVA